MPKPAWVSVWASETMPTWSNSTFLILWRSCVGNRTVSHAMEEARLSQKLWQSSDFYCLPGIFHDIFWALFRVWYSCWLLNQNQTSINKAISQKYSFIKSTNLSQFHKIHQNFVQETFIILFIWCSWVRICLAIPWNKIKDFFKKLNPIC